MRLTHHQVQPQCPPPAKLRDDCTYLVVGGTGGLGRAIVKFFARLGAKHIMTMSRSGATSQTAFIEEMRNAGVNLCVHQGSIVDIENVRKAVTLAADRPIRGVVQGAMVLHVTSPTTTLVFYLF
jgi:NAD(P)-dependent dehydrogenase (short-subunit alcohol dehydrogenase family)